MSRAPFFFLIIAAIVLWAVSYPLWSSTTKWELALHTGSAVLSLLLLVLLENAGRRSEETVQEKLNVIAEALSDLMESRAATIRTFRSPSSGCARRSGSKRATDRHGLANGSGPGESFRPRVQSRS